METWLVKIVEGMQSGQHQQHADQISERIVADMLTTIASKGWTVRHMMPNGVNRWTIAASKDEPEQPEG